jgi:class 3 adenylate cyclase
MRRLDVALGEPSELPAMTAGDQLIVLVNPTARELLVRVERAGDRAFALSGARAIATAAFRELFPDQALAPGRLIAITQATLVVAQLADAARLFDELGDAKAFPIAARFFEEVTRLAREHGGTLVKTFGGLALAAFEGAGPAVDVGLAIQAALDAHPTTSGMLASVAVHRGPMMALTQAGRLDYFGQHVERALTIDCPPGVVALSNAVCQDPAVAERLVAAIEQLGIEPMPQGAWVLRVRAPRGARTTAP